VAESCAAPPPARDAAASPCGHKGRGYAECERGANRLVASAKLNGAPGALKGRGSIAWGCAVAALPQVSRRKNVSVAL